MAGTGNPELDRMISRLTRQVEKMQDLPQRLAEVKGQGEAGDGYVKVIVGHTGKVESLEINPRAMRMDSQTLTEELLKALQGAYDDMQRTMQEIMQPAMDDNPALNDIVNGGTGAARQLPQDVLDAPNRVARAEDPVAEVTKQLKRLQDML